ncbi:J domain-containing protein [Desulfitibacter alkalitolerans]|uniref:J domain-containing protein n=1 Tax=Desulfitibacter alkalitolerans TaxID=264641 RepID=UPI000480BD08|nr:DnaJ domain-containing protein [Desulfitibacter alkalitolerans]
MFDNTWRNPDAAKKKKKPQHTMENYYKILGTTANASQKKIKEKYIEGVKAFPPETHPEEFQKIRMAYETLKSPQKRSEYDFARKYGGKIDKIIDKGNYYLEKGQMDKALQCFEDALKIDSTSVQVMLTLAYISYELEKTADFNLYLDRAYETAPEDYKIYVLLGKTRILVDGEEYEEALSVLHEIHALHPHHVHDYYVLFRNVYLELDMLQNLWEMAQAKIDSLPNDKQEPEDIVYYLNWIDAMAYSGKWNFKGKVLSQTKKYLKSLKMDEEEREFVIDSILFEYEGNMGVHNYKTASIFMELLRLLQPNDSVLKKEFSLLQKKMALRNEIDMIHKDEELFPLVYIAALETYLKEHSFQAYLEFSASVPDTIHEDFGFDDEGFAEGLARLKKRYKLVYLEYQEMWDEMFAEKLPNLNREARRKIKY